MLFLGSVGNLYVKMSPAQSCGCQFVGPDGGLSRRLGGRSVLPAKWIHQGFPVRMVRHIVVMRVRLAGLAVGQRGPCIGIGRAKQLSPGLRCGPEIRTES
jgi:hypothetical protein